MDLRLELDLNDPLSEPEGQQTRRKRRKQRVTDGETIWAIVQRNVRYPEKPPAKKDEAAAGDGEEGNGGGNASSPFGDLDFLGLGGGGGGGGNGGSADGGGDLLENLFGGGGTTKTKGKGVALDGPAEAGPSLSMSSEGNLVFDDSMFGGGASTSRTLDFASMLEGRQVVNENFQDGIRVQPFAGAYKSNRGHRWSEDEERQFYRALRRCGTDLMLVKAFMPQFTEKQIHSKFKIEEKRNPQKIEAALTTKRRKLSVREFEEKHGAIDVDSHYRPEVDESEDELAIGSGASLALRYGGKESRAGGRDGVTDEVVDGGPGRLGGVFDDAEGILSMLGSGDASASGGIGIGLDGHLDIF